jgi:hypothetical protein
MKLLLRAQMDLFVSPTRRSKLLSSERQEVVALLRTLLMEALIKPAGGPSGDAEAEVGNE